MLQCPICSSEVPASQASCPSCGALLDPGLPSGTTLAGHYRLDSQLGSGGFAITYRGLDTKLGRPVAIKELFPDGSTRQAATVMPSRTARSGWDQMVQSFSAEGRTLVDLENLALPGLVRVHDVFEANHTSYMVMELLQGQSLSEVIALAPGGRLPEARVLELARDLCRTLEALHGRKILHRDLKPDNIMLVANRGPVLIDFGSARQFSAATAGMTTILTAGYAPLEQYSRQGRFGPPTDLYSLAATLYHAAVGAPPPAATDLVQGAPLPAPSAMVPGFSRTASDAIMAALSIAAPSRPQTAADFLAMLQQPQAPPPPQAAPYPPRPAPYPPQAAPYRPPAPPKRTPSRRIHRGWPLLLVALGVVSWIVYTGISRTPPAAISPSSISPGHATPKEAVDGFFHARFQGNETLACSYASPASRANCSSQNSQAPAINGNIAFHHAVVSGKFALVELTGHLCYPGRACENNTNPLLKMPASSASFQQVYNDLVKSTTYTFSPYPCLRVGGMWYVNLGP